MPQEFFQHPWFLRRATTDQLHRDPWRIESHEQILGHGVILLSTAVVLRQGSEPQGRSISTTQATLVNDQLLMMVYYAVIGTLEKYWPTRIRVCAISWLSWESFALTINHISSINNHPGSRLTNYHVSMTNIHNINHCLTQTSAAINDHHCITHHCLTQNDQPSLQQRYPKIAPWSHGSDERPLFPVSEALGLLTIKGAATIHVQNVKELCRAFPEVKMNDWSWMNTDYPSLMIH